MPLVVAVLAGSCGCRFAGRSSEPSREVPTAHAERAAFRVTIEEVGVIRSQSAEQIKAPFMGTVQKVLQDGAPVAAGDAVLWMDTKDLLKRAGELDADLHEAQSERDKQLERMAFQAKSTKLDVQVSEANVRFADQKLETARRAEADAARQLALGLISTQSHDDKAQALRSAVLADEKAHLAHQRKLEEIASADRGVAVQRQQAERQFDQTRASRDDVARQIEEAMVKSPVAGSLFLPRQRFRGNGEERSVRVGDFVGPWTGSLAQIPDRSRLEVRSQVAEAAMSRVAVGTPVEIRATAVQGLVVAGHVQRLDVLAVPRSKSEGAGFSAKSDRADEQVVFPVVVELAAMDPRLQPGMTVAVSYVLSTVPDAVSVPEAAVLGGSSKPIVLVKTPRGPAEREVALGASSNGRVVVTKGLAGGEEVYLGDPRESAGKAASS